MFKGKRSQEHMVDSVFTLGLFCAFAATAFLLVMIGVGVYRNIVSQMQDTYSTRTALSYLAEKVRQHDVSGGPELTGIGEETALRFTQETPMGSYATYVYYVDGYLCELTIPETEPADPAMGERILAVPDLCFRDAGNGFLEVTAQDSQGRAVQILLHARSSQEGS